jgi:hypothetical protein
VVAAFALSAGLLLFIAAGLLWAARLVHVGNLDAQALAEKLATPWPVSALEWPELRVCAVVRQPGPQPVVLVQAERPGHEGQESTLLVQLDSGEGRGLLLLTRWCEQRCAISPGRRGPTGFELRRRQSLERVCGRMLAEDAVPATRVRDRPMGQA